MPSPKIEQEKRAASDGQPSAATGSATESETTSSDRPLGVTIVAAIVALNGLVDVLGGVGLAVTPAGLLGVLLVGLGAFKLYVARGLLLLRARALGWGSSYTRRASRSGSSDGCSWRRERSPPRAISRVPR